MDGHLLLSCIHKPRQKLKPVHMDPPPLPPLSGHFQSFISWTTLWGIAQDYYETLGVSRSADKSEIKAGEGIGHKSSCLGTYHSHVIDTYSSLTTAWCVATCCVSIRAAISLATPLRLTRNTACHKNHFLFFSFFLFVAVLWEVAALQLRNAVLVSLM